METMTRLEVELEIGMVTREHIDLVHDKDYTEVRNFRNSVLRFEEKVEKYLLE